MKMANGFQPSTIYRKRFILDAWQDSECFSDRYDPLVDKLCSFQQYYLFLFHLKNKTEGNPKNQINNNLTEDDPNIILKKTRNSYFCVTPKNHSLIFVSWNLWLQRQLRNLLILAERDFLDLRRLFRISYSFFTQ